MQVKFFEKFLFRSRRTPGTGVPGQRECTPVFRTIICVVAAMLGFSNPQLSAQDYAGVSGLNLAEARQLARRVHPALEVARQAVEVAAALERQSGARINPTFTFAREQTSGNGGTNWQNIVVIGQAIEIGGQRGARQAVARHRRRAAEANLAAAEAQIDFEVGRAYALAVAAHYRVARTAEAAEAFSRAREIGAARLAEGDVSGYEYRRIALEAARYAALEAEMTLALHRARLTLATLLAVSGDSISAFAGAMKLVDSIATWSADWPLDSLLSLAFRQRSDLRAAGFEVEASVAGLRLASRQAVPTPVLALGFKNERAAADVAVSRGFTLQVSLPIPLWDRRRGATEAARAETRSVEAQQAALRRNVAHEVEDAWRSIAVVTEQLAVLRPLLGAEARLALHAVKTAYAEGEISLLVWLDAVRAYQEAQSSFGTLQGEHMIRLVTLERAVGSTLSGGIDQ